MVNPLEWMKAVRDHPDRPAVAQRMVLDALALRMDWRTGCGFASTGTLAVDADCSERTVRNATMWARHALMLVQTKRGHRRGDGTTRASEWRLALSTGTHMPVDISTGTQVPVEASTGTDEVSTGKPAGLNRQMGASQPAPTAPPSELETSELETSLSRISTGTGEPGDGANGDERENDDFEEDEEEPNPYAALLAKAVPGADPRDIDWALDSLGYRKAHGEIGSIPAYLRKIITNGDAPQVVSDAAAERRRAAAIPPGYDPFGRPAAVNGRQADPWAPAAPFAGPVVAGEVIRDDADTRLTGTPETRMPVRPAEDPPVPPWKQVECPVCKAAPGMYCINAATHKERLRAASAPQAERATT